MDATIADDSKPVVCARSEAKHQARFTNHITYEMARREMKPFILKVVEDTWVRKLKDVETFYTNVSPMALIKHIKLSCTGKNALNLLVLQNKM